MQRPTTVAMGGFTSEVGKTDPDVSSLESPARMGGNKDYARTSGTGYQVPGIRCRVSGAVFDRDRTPGTRYLFQSHLDPRVLVIHLRILSQQFLCLFRNHFRKRYLHIDKLITARSRIAQRWSTALSQAKLLA